MKRDIPMYILTIALLGIAVYLRSPLVAIMTVGLWGVHTAEAVFTRKNRDADIIEMQDTMASHKAKMDSLTRDISNVAERARTILGENY